MVHPWSNTASIPTILYLPTCLDVSNDHVIFFLPKCVRILQRESTIASAMISLQRSLFFAGKAILVGSRVGCDYSDINVHNDVMGFFLCYPDPVYVGSALHGLDSPESLRRTSFGLHIKPNGMGMGLILKAKCAWLGLCFHSSILVHPYTKSRSDNELRMCLGLFSALNKKIGCPLLGLGFWNYVLFILFSVWMWNTFGFGICILNFLLFFMIF